MGAAALALDRKALDVQVLKLEGLSVIADYFVICSGESTTQVKAVAEHIKKTFSKKNIKLLGLEGLGFAHWVLMDYGDVVVHVFEDETRAYYELEKLWLDAPRIPVSESKGNLGRKK